MALAGDEFTGRFGIIKSFSERLVRPLNQYANRPNRQLRESYAASANNDIR